MLKHLLRKIWYSFFTHHPYGYIGVFLVKIFPDRTSHARGTFYGGSNRSFLEKLIHCGLEKIYHSAPEEEQRRLNREQFWGAKAGKRWHALKRNVYSDDEMFIKEFLRFRGPLARQISELLSIDRRYRTICEVGTGNGMFLKYLSIYLSILSKFKAFYGN